MMGRLPSHKRVELAETCRIRRNESGSLKVQEIVVLEKTGMKHVQTLTVIMYQPWDETDEGKLA